MASPVTIDTLLNEVPDSPSIVLNQLRAHPELAPKQDSHGYSLVHAATSYGHIELLRALVQELHVDPDIQDEDGETALFNAESVEMAKELIQLGVDVDLKNSDGQTAAEKLDDEEEQPTVAAYLREFANTRTVSRAEENEISTGVAEAGGADCSTDGIHPPPPLPNGVQISLGTMQADEAGGEPDPEFRRRIEELAARENFQTEEGQRELRELVSEAVSGLAQNGQGPAASRRRLG